MWNKTEDGSILDENGKVIFFSTSRFLRDIADGECCFLCGAEPGSKPFNDEHILPRWLLKQYDLFDKTVTLPNGNTLKYGSYVVPCCAECNTLMGDVVESPVSVILKQGCDAINDYVKDGGLLKIFVWMGLIFLKAHLKDRILKMHLDPRLGTHTIAKEFEYDWADLHHLHSLVRCFVTGAQVTRDAVGSFLTLPVNAKESEDEFDFVDLSVAQSMLLRLGDISLYAVFDDSGAAMSQFYSRWVKITGPVNGLQMREIIADFACINIHLKNRPKFMTRYHRAEKWSEIVGVKPARVELHELNKEIRGGLLYKAVDHALDNIKVGELSKEEIANAIRSGDFTFLFDESGNFIEDIIIESDAGAL